MREIPSEEIQNTVRALCITANENLPTDVETRLYACQKNEPWPQAAKALTLLQENAKLARNQHQPICQDTGMACVFLELGQDVHISGDTLDHAVNEGVRQGYTEGFLRKSIVADPLRRNNTGDNTPAFLHTDLVAGDKLRITVAPKGIGSENMSRLAMLPPSAGQAGAEEFILETIRLAGGNPCPPIVVGVGLGGNFDQAPLLAKKALLRSLDTPNPDPFYAELENQLLARINGLGIGPQGFGGHTTALAVCIEVGPTHIAGLPVAVNLNCHAARHASATL